jgi:hypothetical protein
LNFAIGSSTLYKYTEPVESCVTAFTLFRQFQRLA